MTDNSPTSSISAAERELLMSANSARRRILRNQPLNQKEVVTPEEYAERLRNSLRKDATLLTMVKEDTIEKSVKKWAATVDATFSHAATETPAIVDRVSRLKRRQGLHKTSIVLYGDQLGRGKTWNAYAYLNQIVAVGAATPGQIVYGTEGSTMSALANSGYQRTDNTNEFLRESHKFFFIDDVGQGYYFKEQARHEVWYALIDHVYTRQQTLILTTNLAFNERELGGWIGFRAFDRLKSLVGDDGAIRVTGVNRREEVLRQNEEQYRNK